MRLSVCDVRASVEVLVMPVPYAWKVRFALFRAQLPWKSTPVFANCEGLISHFVKGIHCWDFARQPTEHQPNRICCTK
jgi:hypothetical protein